MYLGKRSTFRYLNAINVT